MLLVHFFSRIVLSLSPDPWGSMNTSKSRPRVKISNTYPISPYLAYTVFGPLYRLSFLPLISVFESGYQILLSYTDILVGFEYGSSDLGSIQPLLSPTSEVRYYQVDIHDLVVWTSPVRLSPSLQHLMIPRLGRHQLSRIPFFVPFTSSHIVYKAFTEKGELLRGHKKYYCKITSPDDTFRDVL